MKETQKEEQRKRRLTHWIGGTPRRTSYHVIIFMKKLYKDLEKHLHNSK
jgi:hypothetical protein